MKQQDTKNKIIEKALELFSKNGYDSVSVAQIAEAVGIKAPSLYNHFTSKREIFDDIVKNTATQYEKYTDEIDVHIQDVKKDINVFTNITQEFLIQKVRQIFLYSIHNKTISRFRRMMTIEQFRSTELARLYSDRFIDRLVTYHSNIFDKLIKCGELKAENADTLALMYTAPVISLLGICDRQPEREQECLIKLDEHVRLFYRTFRQNHIS